MKILIIHATAGLGHKKAAEYIAHGFKDHPECDVTLVDALDYTPKLFAQSYTGTYETMVSYAPSLWAFAFTILNIPFLQPLVRILRRIYNGLFTSKLVKYLQDEQFDTIISTQFLSVEVVGHLKRTGKIQSKLIAMVTDYDVHRIWLNSHVDHYCVACDTTRNRLLHYGVNSEYIHVTGIPVDAKFTQDYNIDELKDKLHLRKDLPTVLITTSSFGFGPIEEIVNALTDVQLLVICGRNETLYNTLKGKADDRVHIFSFVKNMHELMAVADIIITKPGGLTTTESLVNHLAIIFFAAIPGQETKNIRVLANHGVGFNGKYLADIVDEVHRLATDTQSFEQTKNATKSLAKPHAVKDIIALLKTL